MPNSKLTDPKNIKIRQLSRSVGKIFSSNTAAEDRRTKKRAELLQTARSKDLSMAAMTKDNSSANITLLNSTAEMDLDINNDTTTQVTFNRPRSITKAATNSNYLPDISEKLNSLQQTSDMEVDTIKHPGKSKDAQRNQVLK